MVVHRRGPWSQHEDQWLVNLVARNGPHNWVRISQEIGSRSPKQCRERYHQNLKPSLNHNPITPDEGEQIERMVQEMGKRWAEIARRLKGRSDNAVKNWWNGGQNRRKRNPERDHRGLESLHSGYHYAPQPMVHPSEQAPHASQYPLPPLNREHSDPSSYYSHSRRPSLSSPHTLKLPQPHAYEPYPGSRPQALELQPVAPYTAPRGRYETPIPSPGYSVVSVDTLPSMITDTGSESRSPRGVPSPVDQGVDLPPLVGGRSERKNSSTRYLPQTGFAPEDDDHHFKRRSSVQLPPLNRTEPSGPAPTFHEPNYQAEHRSERPQLLTQPLQQTVHHHSLPKSPLGLAAQRPLPPYQNLSAPTAQVASTATSSPSSNQLPSLFVRPTHPGLSRSAPTSPRNESQDSRMKLANIL